MNETAEAEILHKAASLMCERAKAYDTTGRTEVNLSSNVAHVRSWHPDVALAVAMLLDNEANAMAAYDQRGGVPYNNARRALLTDVARAYLGRSA